MSVTQDTVHFGKYKGQPLSRVLRDRNYCAWLLKQEWMQEQYAYFYNRIREYRPLQYFLPSEMCERVQRGTVCIDNVKDPVQFIDTYPYFHLYTPSKVQSQDGIDLTPAELYCYTAYRNCIQTLVVDKMYDAIENEEDNVYAIRAPSRWLMEFEKQYGIPRTDMKEFLCAHDLPNIPYIVRDVKRQGGITYDGSESYNIGKARSARQETFWENALKELYGEHICVQYQYKDCFFDMLNIASSTVFECKLAFKDFHSAQYAKYVEYMDTFRIIYLFGNDTILDIHDKTVYTLSPEKVETFKQRKRPRGYKETELDRILSACSVVAVDSILECAFFKDAANSK